MIERMYVHGLVDELGVVLDAHHDHGEGEDEARDEQDPGGDEDVHVAADTSRQRGGLDGVGSTDDDDGGRKTRTGASRRLRARRPQHPPIESICLSWIQSISQPASQSVS